MNALRHFGTITKHKLLVMKACFQVGLYRQGLLHDLSKYGWTEFREVLRGGSLGSKLTLAIRSVMSCTSFSYVLLRLNHCHVSKYAAPPTVLGKKALECMPKILQGFVAKPADVEKGLDFDRKLYIARKVFEQSNEESYVVSLSSRTIVYKGMFLVGQLRTFFNDLQDSDYESAIALVHSRFSTNTTPSWEKAHPYRFIVHNGEINTIRGNADKMLAREENMESCYYTMNCLILCSTV